VSGPPPPVIGVAFLTVATRDFAAARELCCTAHRPGPIVDEPCPLGGPNVVR
jgi:hypothetical protein